MANIIYFTVFHATLHPFDCFSAEFNWQGFSFHVVIMYEDQEEVKYSYSTERSLHHTEIFAENI